jgi:hypothetical protein
MSLEQLKTWLASRLRDDRFGYVCWTPDFMGFGNVLYLLHWADTLQQNGINVRVLQTGAVRIWLPVFPELRPLLIERAAVGVRQVRLMPWSEAGRAALPPDLVAAEQSRDPGDEYASFLSAYLLPGARRALAAQPVADDSRLVVNVRRGDYYSDPDNRRHYGFPIVPYLQTAVRGALASGGPAGEILVVSDDPAWCEANLSFLRDLAPTVTFADRSDGPVGDFFLMVAHRRLVMTNSTFSYWAARIGTQIHGDNHRQIWAPRFFDRSRDGGRSTLVDERWTIVEEIPGGWDLPS